MSHQIRRWFNPPTIQQMVTESQEAIRDVIKDIEHKPPKKAEKNAVKHASLMTGYVLTVLIVAAIVAALIAGYQVLPGNVSAALILVGFLAAFWVITYLYVQLADSIRDQRIRSFQNYSSKRENLFALEESILPRHNFPFFDDEDGRKFVKGMLAGVINRMPFYWIEVMQSIDFMANMGSGTKTIATAIGHGKQARIVIQSVDVIVFATPIATTADLFVCPIGDPNRAYAYQKLKDHSFELEIYRTVDKNNEPSGSFSLCSDKRWTVPGAFDELRKLLVKYPDLCVQIFGGFVAVHRQPFDSSNLMGCVCTESQIKEFFEIACDVYRSLKKVERLFVEANAM